MIDLRSDTVTRPSAGMRRAMAEAAVGDDVWGDDPTVRRLEAAVAERLGKDAAVFVTSGTQSNLCALMAHCERGDEYIVGQQAHTYKYEAGGGAVLGSIQPQPLDFLPDGTLDLDQVAAVVKPDDPHFARTRLLCLENTHDGGAIGVDYLRDARRVADRHGLAMHLDGARLWNAAVVLGLPESTLAEPFDSVSVCLSKGLGAPVGSLLCGDAEVVAQARRWRKMLGGAMRQTGVVAAAGLYALEHNVARLADDHANAARLAAGLADIDSVEILGQRTNMVFVRVPDDGRPLADELAAVGVTIAGDGPELRLVCHLDVTADDVDKAIAGFAAVMAA